MTRLVWDQVAQRRYEAGVDRGVFYPLSGPGEVWNGLTSVQESPSDTDERVHFMDGVKTRTGRRPGNFAGVIEAFTYPASFYEQALVPRRSKPFGLSYRTKSGDSYKIHLVYNVLLGPTSHLYEQEDAVPFSWEFTTLPVGVPDARPCAHLVIDSSIAYSATMEDFEALLYGSDEADARFPSPAEVMEIFEANSILRVIDHGDGLATIIGPDDVISMVSEDRYLIDYSTVVYISSDTATIRSL